MPVISKERIESFSNCERASSTDSVVVISKERIESKRCFTNQLNRGHVISKERIESWKEWGHVELDVVAGDLEREN